MTHIVIFYMKGKPRDSKPFPSFKEAQTFAIAKRAEANCELCVIQRIK